MLAGYDRDPVTALAAALTVVLGSASDGAGYDELLDRAPLAPARRAALHRREQLAMDGLLTELNELRTLGPPHSPGIAPTAG